MGSPSTASKSNAIRRFFLCFRPSVAHDEEDDEMLNPNHLTSKDAVAAADLLTSIAVEEKERVSLPGALPDKDASPDEDDENVVGSRREQRSKRFSKIMKAVMFETSLSNKMRKRKSMRKSSPTSEDPQAEQSGADLTPNSSTEESSESDNGGSARPTSSSSSSGSLTETCTDSPSSSFTVGSSSSSSIPSISRSPSLQCKKPFEPNTEETKQQQQQQQQQQPQTNAKQQQQTKNGNNKSRSYDSIGNLCLVLLSLAALVFFGKACAIFCTSTCFFFVPRLSRPRNDRSAPSSKTVTAETDSAEKRGSADT